MPRRRVAPPGKRAYGEGVKKVLVYTANPCPFCSRAKALLASRGIPFEEVLVSYDDEAAWDELAERSGMKTMPQIFADGKLVGGFQELAELDARDQLASLR
jgi:glutaredoxin 3